MNHIQVKKTYTPIDKWIDTPTPCDGTKDLYDWTVLTVVKTWLNIFLTPAFMQKECTDWLASQVITVEYEGVRYRLVGCSTMGDVWLAADLNKECGYDKRVMVDDLSNWQVKGINKPAPI
jgi:hypothetical protein